MSFGFISNRQDLLALADRGAPAHVSALPMYVLSHVRPAEEGAGLVPPYAVRLLVAWDASAAIGFELWWEAFRSLLRWLRPREDREEVAAAVLAVVMLNSGTHDHTTAFLMVLAGAGWPVARIIVRDRLDEETRGSYRASLGWHLERALG